MLRKEYLNQTFNFLPRLREAYDKAAKNQYYEYAQDIVKNLEEYTRFNDSVVATVDYFAQLLEYMTSTKGITDGLTKEIETFVSSELDRQDVDGHDGIVVQYRYSTERRSYTQVRRPQDASPGPPHLLGSLHPRRRLRHTTGHHIHVQVRDSAWVF